MVSNVRARTAELSEEDSFVKFIVSYKKDNVHIRLG